MSKISIPVKRTIAILVTLIFCFISIYGMVYEDVAYNDIIPVITMVIGYYFGNVPIQKIGHITRPIFMFVYYMLNLNVTTLICIYNTGLLTIIIHPKEIKFS